MGWYVTSGGDTGGPFDDDAVIEAIQRGLKPTARICEVGTDSWLDLASYLPFAEALRGAAPPPPPPLAAVAQVGDHAELPAKTIVPADQPRGVPSPIIAAATSALAVLLALGIVLFRTNTATTSAAPQALAASSMISNRWIRVDPITSGPDDKAWLLGLDTDSAPIAIRGFRPSRKIAAPTAPYEIQQHEVTWAELDEWLENNAPFRFAPPPRVPDDKEKRARLPATGVPWSTADAYCTAANGALPTEEQWEYAGRGADRRKFPWGGDKIEREGTHAFVGLDGEPAPVMSNSQDRTPSKENGIYDMAGNAREWTHDAYRDEVDEKPPAWAAREDMVFRVVRGLPLYASTGVDSLADSGIAYREPICTNGQCLVGAHPTDERIVMISATPDTKRDATEAWRVFREWLVSTDVVTVSARCGSSTSLTAKLTGARSACASTNTKATRGNPDWRQAYNESILGDENPENGCRSDEYYSRGWTLFPAAVHVSSSSDSDIATAACVKQLDPLLKSVRLPEKASDSWAASIRLTLVAPQPASKLYDVGFRCARSIPAK